MAVWLASTSASAADYPKPAEGRPRRYLAATPDDLINPPELGIPEREIKRVPHGGAVVIPMSEQTHGHGSHTYAVLWKQYPVELLASRER